MYVVYISGKTCSQEICRVHQAMSDELFGLSVTRVSNKRHAYGSIRILDDLDIEVGLWTKVDLNYQKMQRI